MKAFAWCALLTMVGCGNVRRSETFDVTGCTLADVTLTFGDRGQAQLELTIKDPRGVPVATLPEHVPRFEVELKTTNQADVAGLDSKTLCKGSMYPRSTDLDSQTKRLRLTFEFESQLQPGDRRTCQAALLEDGVKGPVVLHVQFGGLNSPSIRHEERLDDFVVADTRPGNLPELDAELERLTQAIGALDPAAPLPACSAARVAGDQPLAPLEAVEPSAFLVDEAPWAWASTSLFKGLTQYKLRRNPDPARTLQQLRQSPRVLVYLASKRALPRTVDDEKFEPGIFTGRAIVLDRATKAAVCGIPVAVTSSSNIGYTRHVETRAGHEVRKLHDDADWQLQDDFSRNFGVAVEAALTKAGIGAATPAEIVVEREMRQAERALGRPR